ncbi:MAG: hypothetical protein IPM47_09880 [Sphingobacteriales bacterium]|nr:MAG: hypothetical protein IPM47_09880 [Sphingobacteriales bacterium]
MYRLMLIFVWCLMPMAFLYAERGDIISFTLMETKTVAELQTEATAATGLPPSLFGFEYDIAAYKVLYETVDYDGMSSTIASALVSFPTNYPCAPPMCTYGHGLALKHWEAPSSLNNIYSFIGKGIASNGYISLTPDYIHLGYDASPGFQAFMHATTESAATIDLIRATRTYCQNSGIDFNDQLFISGYSQGGHSSMATCKQIQEHHSDEFSITAAMPGGGTYDLSGIAADSLASPTRTTGEPHAFCLISRAYYEIYQPELISMGITTPFFDYFKSPYDSLLTLILDATNPFANTSLLDSIPNRMLEDIYREEFLYNPDFWMRDFLAFNDLYDWSPQMPMRLFHSDADVENPFPNVLFTLEQFGLNGAADVELQTVSGFSHSNAGLYHALALRQWFGSLRESCAIGIHQEIPELLKATAYPNPFSDICTIDLSNVRTQVSGWELLTIQGQSLQSGTVAGGQQTISFSYQTNEKAQILVLVLSSVNGQQSGIPLIYQPQLHK